MLTPLNSADQFFGQSSSDVLTSEGSLPESPLIDGKSADTEAENANGPDDDGSVAADKVEDLD